MKKIIKIKKIIIIVLPIFFISGCLSKNVYFNKQVYVASNSLNVHAKQPVIRTYQDNLGDYYPENTSRSSFGLADIRSQNKEWEEIQERTQNNIANQISQALDAKNNKKPTTLVILIHGFNVPNAEAIYAHTRDIINSFSQQNESTIYWQVNWDGMSGDSLTANSGAWKGAQTNGPLAGLKMRSVLNQVISKNSNIKIRILTHSSGAFVAATLLGNNTNALPLAKESLSSNCGGHYRLFCLHVKDISGTGRYRVPQPNDLRLGMLAPATPYNSFAMLPTAPDAEYQRASTDGLLVKKMKLIVGANSEDYAISKSFFSSVLHGATSLGMGAENCGYLATGLIDMKNDTLFPRKIKAECINFSFSTTYNDTEFKFWESHDLSIYLQRDMMPKFLRSLFE